MKALILTLSLTLLLTTNPFSRAQESASPADAIARERAAAYVAAWEKKDPKSVASLYAADATYSTDSGDTFQGQTAIQEQLQSYFTSNPDSALTLVTESARFLTPDVLVENGTSTVTSGNASEVTTYSATHVKKDGQWLIAEVHESVVSSTEPAEEALASLEWMIGKWRMGDSADSPTSEATWTLDGSFISRTTRITKDDGASFVSVEVIGYDPTSDQLRSWIFDNEGGFGESTWRQDGDKWLVNISATLPDGSQASSQHVITLVDETHITLDNVNRVVSGEVLPNRDRIAITRIADETPKASDK